MSCTDLTHLFWTRRSVGIVEQLPLSESYNNFSYHISLLRDFIPRDKVNAVAAIQPIGAFNKRASVWQEKGSKNFVMRDAAATISNGLVNEDRIDIGQTMHNGKSARTLVIPRKMNRSVSVFM